MMNIKDMSKEERAQLLAELQNEEKKSRIERRETYEGLRASFMKEVEENVVELTNAVGLFKEWLAQEVESFVSIMKEYGQVRKSDQRSYTITDGDFRLEISSNKVKGFDERADLAELEDKFDSEYSEIMTLFKEANVVQKNAINYYFSKKNQDTNVWERIEPSFCRL